MNEKEVKATHRGVLHIANVDIRCFVLEDKRRVISGRSLTQAIGMKGRGPGASRIVTHSALKDFISPSLTEAIENPIYFRVGRASNRIVNTGFEATILRQVCESILSARDAGALKTEQEQRYAKSADILIRAFATVGIIALVDEATGYQAEREKDELQTILSAYIAPELMPWTRRFPPEFYKEMFRLWGWKYQPLSLQRPRLAGKLTSQLIYEKLPKGVLEDLRLKNPPDETGRRRHKHHQFLTDDIGNPHLEKQVALITMLFRISPNKRVFWNHFARAFPADIEQMTFEFAEEENEE